MPTDARKWLLAVTTLCLLFTGYFLLLPPDPPVNSRNTLVPPQPEKPAATAPVATWNKGEKPASTPLPDELGSHWKQSHHPASVGVDKSRVLNALATIRVDEAGNLVVDNQGLQALYQSLGYGMATVNPEQLTAIKAIIADNLPEPTAGQTVTIVDNFYRYLNAKSELEALYPSTHTATELGVYLAELDVLREWVFGTQQAQQLFQQQHKHEQYMLENLRLVENTQLTESQRTSARQSLRTTYFPDSTSGNWQSRLTAYLNQKTHIEQAALSNAEKNLQLKALRNNYFNKEEQQRLPDFESY